MRINALVRDRNMDILSLLKSALGVGPWFVVSLLSLLIAYEALRILRGRKGD
jgi:hypothetical protein